MAEEIGALSGPAGAENSVRKQQYMEQIGQTREVPVWERDDAPPGSTAESLLVFSGGVPVRVAGPTHYQHLADGRIVGGFGGGTHYADVDEAGNQRVTRVIGNHAAQEGIVKKQHLLYLGIFLGGVVLSARVRAIPVVGSKIPALQATVAASTGIVLATGAVTAANEVLFAPLAGQKVSFNWRIVPATAGLALALAALEKIAPGFAIGLAWLSLATATLVQFGNAPTPLDNLLKVMGYKK